MRPKNVNKKLSLNKKTIVNLANAEQRYIRGGAEYTAFCLNTNVLTCETECVSCPCTQPDYNTCASCDFSCPDVGTCDCGGTIVTGGDDPEPKTFTQERTLCY